MFQSAAFATGLPPDLYVFHRYTGNSALLSHPLAEQSPRTFRVRPGDFTEGLPNRLRSLYAQ